MRPSQKASCSPVQCLQPKMARPGRRASEPMPGWTQRSWWCPWWWCEWNTAGTSPTGSPALLLQPQQSTPPRWLFLARGIHHRESPARHRCSSCGRSGGRYYKVGLHCNHSANGWRAQVSWSQCLTCCNAEVNPAEGSGCPAIIWDVSACPPWANNELKM